MNEFEPNKLLNYDKQSIIAELKRVYFKFYKDKRMTGKEFNLHSRVSSTTVIKHFGSWQSALQEAEIYIEKIIVEKKKSIPLPEIKKDIQRVVLLNKGKYFTFVFYKQNGGRYSTLILTKRFGCKTWEELLNKEFSLHKRIIVINKKVKKEASSKEELFNEMKIVWDKFGRRPTYAEFRENASFGIGTYEKRFGSWVKAVEQFYLVNENYNIGVNSKSLNTSKELLLKELQKIKDTHNLEVLEQTDYKKYGGNYSIQTFHNHFGSWKNAVHAIGLKSGRSAPTKEELFDELQRIWEELGRQPHNTEMKTLSKYSHKSYTHKFGGWTKAIYAFIADRQKEEEEIIFDSQESKTEIVVDNVIETINAEVSIAGETIIMKTPRSVPPKLRFRVFMRDSFTCQYCKRTKEEDGVKLQADHIIAYSNGGETVFENLITACWDCNIGKSNMEL